MKRCIKSVMILLVISIVVGIIPNVVKATDEPYCVDDDIYVCWTIKNEKGEEVEGIRGGGDYGLQDLVIPGYNDYTNCYFEIKVNEYVGNSIKLDNLGTFTYTNKTRTEFDLNWYIYELKITDTAKFNKPTSSAQQFNFIITVESSGKSYQAWLDYKVVGERKVYKVENDNISIAVEASSDEVLSLKAEEISKGSDTYLEMIEYINKKCDNDYLGSFEISLVGGDYKGNLDVTFSVGEQYNGKKVIVCHKKANGTYEEFEKTVKNGNVTITVSELSPFMIALVKENGQTTATTSTNETTASTSTTKKELDETPKTGIVELAYYVLPIAFISALGIIIFNKKKNK